MSQKNKHDLSRNIPEGVKRQVRKNCGFGCIICRSGIYQYEHIIPEYSNAEEHDPNKICCLCGTCHDAVTRGIISKETIANKYIKIQESVKNGKVTPPTGPIDITTKCPTITIGSFLYKAGLSTLVKYHDKSIISFSPGRDGEPGRIDALIHDRDGNLSFQIIGNEWIGPTNKFDMRVKGKSLKIWEKRGETVLQLVLNPPNDITVKYLDMKIGSGHIIATDKTYVIGRYHQSSISWVHATMQINRCSSKANAIEFTSVVDLEMRDLYLGKNSQELHTNDRKIVMNAFNGIMIKPLGIALGAFTGSHSVANVAVGQQPINKIREVIKKHPNEICRFIATGKTA